MSDERIKLIMKLLMVLMLGWFAYTKGWIFADFKNISPMEAKELLESSDIMVVDVRSKEAFLKDHLKGAISAPLERLLDFNLDAKSILVYSERGELSVKASRILAKKGYHVFNLKGGVVFWIRAGYTLEK